MYSCGDDINLVKVIISSRPLLDHNFLFSVDCIWGTWSEWGTCTAPCGGGANGKEVRTRTIQQAAANGGISCSGLASESRVCDQQALCGR